MENETVTLEPTTSAPSAAVPVVDVPAVTPVSYFVEGAEVTKEQFYAGDMVLPMEPLADTATASSVETSGYLAQERTAPEEGANEATISGEVNNGPPEASANTNESAQVNLVDASFAEVVSLLARNHETGGLAEYMTITIVTPDAIRVAVGQINPPCEYYTREGKPSVALQAAVTELLKRKGKLVEIESEMEAPKV